MNKCTLREWFVPERIVAYMALKLDEDLHLGEATFLLLGETQFLLRRIQITVLDTSADINTKIIAMGIVFFTGIEKIKCTYVIHSCNLDCISSWAG